MMTFIERELFQDKKTNLTFNVRRLVDFLGMDS
jgi:hypothetical protein